MEAVFVKNTLKISEFNEKVISDFFHLWPPPKLKANLFDIFHQLAIHGILDEKGPQYTDDIAQLFDQLIDLVAAAHQLHQEGRAPFHSSKTVHPEQEASHE